MKKRNLIKKVALLGATVAMVMGMATNVMAASSYETTIYMGGNGHARCTIDCYYSSAIAETIVEVRHTATSIYAYAEIELEIYESSGNVTVIGTDRDEKTRYNYTGATASAEMYEYIDYNIGTYGYSSHGATVDGLSNSCYLSAEY